MARARQSSNRTQRSPERRNRASDEQWLTGLHPVREALRARRRRLEGLILRAGRPRAELREITDLAQVLGVPIEEVEVEVLDRRVEGDWNHHGVALR
ncbi:MAG: hypothetical protein JRJ58_20950, partial [Deltaproteobacteria bacterium]|nr:hypothetical protein [Deltaproteobacteria bacterium]